MSRCFKHYDVKHLQIRHGGCVPATRESVGGIALLIYFDARSAPLLINQLKIKDN